MPGPIRTFTALTGEPRSQNANINSLVVNTQWASANLTYSFPTSAEQFTGYNAGEEPFRGFVAAEAPYISAVRFAYRTASEFTSATFTEIAASSASPATMRFGITSDPAPRAGTSADLAGWGYLPGENANAGDVWIMANQNINTAFSIGTFRWSLVIHEIGHVLGLGHPFESGQAGGDVVMDPARDSTEYTIMAYRASTTVPSVSTVGFPEQGGEPQTWMMYDVAALQAIYGANYNTRSGNNTYSWSPTTGQMFVDGAAYMDAPGNNRILLNVWDGGGVDTYDFSNYSTNVQADLRPGGWSSPLDVQVVTTNTQVPSPLGKAPGSISNSLLFNGDTRSLIENVTGGSGSDTLIGNSADNRMIGGAGNDRFQGDVGNDFIDGGSGSDTAFYAGRRSDYIIKFNNQKINISDGIASRDEVDVLDNIESVSFTDGNFDLLSQINGVSLSNQMFMVYFGRGVSSSWRNASAEVAGEGGFTPGLQKAFFDAAVIDRAFTAADTAQAITDKTFQNIFGTRASAFEQEAWAATVTQGGVSREALPWTIFVSYLGAQNVPASYQVPAQLRLIALDAFTNAVTDTRAAAVGNPAAPSADAARAWLAPIQNVDQASAKVISAARDVGSIIAGTWPDPFTG